ncbi:MAG TPA: SpoIID/LytB domain-containing protein [Thermoanaerobaculia bacterium]|nr:SpoIID/LytB domain-containing protein [Thermoanaerobaculia bacterium]
MKRIALTLITLLVCACASAPPARQPAQQAQPARSPNALTPVSKQLPIEDPVIRVGLLSDQPNITFPRIEGGYYVVAGGNTQLIRRGFTDTAPLANSSVVRYAVQVASISDIESVRPFVEKLRTETGQRVDTTFDPSASNGGMYRILAGDFESSAAANPLRADLTQRGYGKDMLVVRRPSDQPFEKRHQLTDDEGDRYTITADEISVMPASRETIMIGEKPYRTSAVVRINARGTFNIINALNMEDYLRGVVPAEMGPKIYDEVEGLKAQAIAARTYAVRNMGQFRNEGYDICPGPACQAYLGAGGEAALSDQAVKETRGLIATYEGKPIDALYTATCGGETSDVGTMFPGRNEPYLKRARCVEMEMTSIAGRSDSQLLSEPQVNARVFAAAAGLPDSGASWSARDVTAATEATLRILGESAPAGVAAPVSSRRGDVLRYLAATFLLDRNGRALTIPEDRQYFFPQTPGVETAPEYLAAAFLIKYGILPAQTIDRIDLFAAMPREELYGLLGSWLREHDALREATGKISAVSGRTITLKIEGKNTNFALPAGIPVFRRIQDRYQEYASVPVMIGDRAFLQRDQQNAVIALIVQANYDGAAFDRTSSFSNWTRTYRAEELVKSINARNPIQELQGLRPVTIDESQRIAELEVTAEGGRTFMLRGLPVRWSLNVPDNLFVIEKGKDPDGVDRYTFYGKGWGHGIGMCQVGAYGMAFRGWTYDQILKRYYTGIEITKMQ